MNRAEAVSMLVRLMKQKMPEKLEFKGLFSDVVAEHWFAKEVEYLAGLGIVTGYDERGGGHYFNPFGPITRAEFTAIVSRFGKLFTAESVSFEDVNSEYWAYPYIVNTAERGWINGYEDGEFRPSNKITRAEAVTIVNRMLGRIAGELMGGISDIGSGGDIKTPTDIKGHWAYDEILAAMNE